MRVMLCHNHYQQPGGEDQSFAAEAALLEARGHDVLRYTLHNDAIRDMATWRVAAKTFYNRDVASELRTMMRGFRPDVVHCTNTFPLISPAVYYAARDAGAAVVQSLRNYRQLCPSALLMRDGKVCEDCVGKAFAWPGVIHGCYRESRLASAVVAGMTTWHSLVGTWRQRVDLYFTLTQFARQKFIQAGWPADRIAVKPNFIAPDPGPGEGQGGYAIFVGRLSPEKGIHTLLDAWSKLPPGMPLKILGQGPLAADVEAFAREHQHVELLGHRALPEVLDLIGAARLLVMPSIWYETFGRTIIEAFARGTPVVASNLGAMAELVEDGVTGLRFTAGSANDLAEKVTTVWNHPLLDAMRRACRREYELRYTADRNYEMLIDLYERAGAQREATRVTPTPAKVS
jgi:glycosyltransferase involved in cell wall biosynthesis